MEGYKYMYKYITLCFMLLPLLFIFGCDSDNLNNLIRKPASNSQKQPDPNFSEKGEQIITYTSASDLITIPDKIIYYHQGNQIILDENNDKFHNIMKMTKDRASNVKDVTKSAISLSDIETLKENNDTLEFVYLKNVAVNWKNNVNYDFIYRFEYNSIIFPLTGEWNKFMIFSPKSPGPLGSMASADELLKYLNQ